MKFLIPMALLIASAAAASPIEHFPAPARPGGQRAPFSSAVKVGDVLYLSGQIGIAPDGKLPEGFDAQARQAMDNVGAVLKPRKIGYDRIFHCTVFLADMKDWPAFNKIYVGYFPDGPLPARSAVDVDALALGALLELECQAYAGRK